MENNFGNNQPTADTTTPPVGPTPVQQPAPTNQPVQQPLTQPTPPTPPMPPTPPEPQPIMSPVSPTPAPQSINKTSFSIKNIIATIAGIVGVISFFLPWVGASGLGMSVSANGTEIGDDYRYMGYFTLILFSIAATITAVNITQKLNPLYKFIISGINGLAAILSIILTIILANEIGEYGSISVGLILLIISGIVGAAAPWLPIKSE